MVRTIPTVMVAPSEGLDAGTLFQVCEEGQAFFALKTAPASASDRATTLILGPTFPFDIKGPTLVDYNVQNALSFGKEFSVRLPSTQGAWSSRRIDQTSVWLALAGDRKFICADGGHKGHYFPCFIDIEDGRLIERTIGAPAVYTNTWEIVVELTDGSIRGIVRFDVSGTS